MALCSVGGVKLFGLHAKVFIKGDGSGDVLNGQNQMIERLDLHSRFPLRVLLRSVHNMHEAIGRTQTLSCQLDPARSQALHRVLGCDGPPPVPGDALPPFWHQIYFWDPLPAENLGRDGHTAKGGFIPDLGLPRRMWAGGELLFHAPIEIGKPAVKTSTIESVTVKQGRSGRLGFCTIRHEITQGGDVLLTDRQNLVFKADPDPARPPLPPPSAPKEAEIEETERFDSTLLFRYSALTLNGHRIHYDLDYARNIEGYPGLVVHGPLIAQKLIMMAEQLRGPLKKFTYRATAPLFAHEKARFCMMNDRLWAAGPDGRLSMTATCY